MDLVTHGLASLAVARGFFPRASKMMMLFTVGAGMVADLDWLSSSWGPSAFLAWHGTYLHSMVLVFLVLIAIPSGPVVSHVLHGKAIVPRQREPQEGGENNHARIAGGSFFAGALLAPGCAALLHIAMDACQSDGVQLVWPFNAKRFAADWLPDIDLWILVILIACIAVPELLRLVSSEIGAKSKKPRGQTGALLGLALVTIYIGARATLHSNAIAAMESRTFHGDAVRRAKAYPESISVLAWHGIAETDAALNQCEINAAATGTFDADASVQIFKPQGSPVLTAARATAAARQFLAFAQVPKASVEKTETGYLVTLRDLRYSATNETSHEIAALIQLDANTKVTSAELLWSRELPR